MIRLSAALVLLAFAAVPADAGWLRRGYEPWEETYPTDRVDWIDAAPQITAPKVHATLGDDAVIALLAERGFWAIAPRRIAGRVFLASATDDRGNRVHVAVDRYTGEVRRVSELGRREVWRSAAPHPY